MLIYNVKIFTAADKDYERGYIKIQDGKIAEVGEMTADVIPAEGDINAEGLTAYPGFIDCHTHIGAWEDGLGFEGDDGNEMTDPATPNLRAIDMINPLDRCFDEAAAAGVTSVVSGMGSANALGGTFLAMKTAGGKRIDSRIIKQPIAVKFALGENPKSVYKDKDCAPITRMATAAIIREQLHKATRYAEDMDAYFESIGSEDELDRPDYDAKCEALLPLLKKEIPAHIHAHRADDIFTAIRLCKEFGLDYVIIHATEGHLIAQELAEEGCPVVVGPILSDRSKPELKNHTIENAAVLHKAGVPLSICTDHPVVPQQYLPLSAALAVRGGLDKTEALRAITINPAKTAGIADRVGSIEVGKDADIVLFDGDPLDVQVTPKIVIIDGIVRK
ncbi:MAG: amidohydrolase [Eubacterium sp.]|nr:amidohydrolase [Eubacterium sp.]